MVVCAIPRKKNQFGEDAVVGLASDATGGIPEGMRQLQCTAEKTTNKANQKQKKRKHKSIIKKSMYDAFTGCSAGLMGLDCGPESRAENARRAIFCRP